MTHSSPRPRALLLVAAILIAVLCVALLMSATAGRAAAQPAAGTPSRAQNPVLVTGADLPAFAGAPLDELVLARYTGGAWEPVPYQFDELTPGGIFTPTEDGLLDGNDQLVFMARDAGLLVGGENWPADAAARQHPRQVITVTDPLSSDTLGWFYLYRSDTFPRSGDSYVAWADATQTLTALSYTLAIESADYFGLSALAINGQPVDILDRQKLRGEATVFVFGIPVSTTTFTEESITDFLTQTLTVTLPIIGPVRAVGGNEAVGFAFYGTAADLSLALPLADIEPAPFTVVHIDYFRTSLDLLNPAGTGFAPARYYDSNSADVPIDGQPDAVPAAPPVSWTQIAGAYGGWVTAGAVDPALGTLTNHYRDDDTPDPEDTGDGLSFGDAGFRIDDPNGTVTIDQALIFLPAGTGNVGAAVAQWPDHPLATTITAETFAGEQLPLPLFLPLALNQ